MHRSEYMKNAWRSVSSLGAALVLLGSVALAEPPHGRPEGQPHAAPARAEPPRGEPHEGPRGYARVAEPKGWNERPSSVDRGAYQHNFQAARSYHIGAYRRPPGWTAHRWGYGEILPHAYWGPQYLIADYWLFALEVPPAGYEWVRDGNDAMLIDTTSGEILQVEYGVFA
jgi:Ni/Co efflux regulator RcnB